MYGDIIIRGGHTVTCPFPDCTDDESTIPVGDKTEGIGRSYVPTVASYIPHLTLTHKKSLI